ncbi:MAG: hypothetical protein DRP45_03380, partial [Candidatus Zixiibacteriota bacterium]
NGTSFVFSNPGGAGPTAGGAADSAGVLYGTVAMFSGLPGGYAGDLTTLEFQSFKADEGKFICLAKSDVGVPGGSWGWWNAGCGAIIPDWTDDFCYEIKQIPNLPPEVTPVAAFAISHCDDYSLQFAATDTETDPIVEFEMNPDDGSMGTITAAGFWEYDHTLMPQSAAVISIDVRARDDVGSAHWGPWETIEFEITNDAPTIVCPADQFATAGSVYDWPFTIGDDCDGMSVAINPSVDDMSIVGGNVHYEPTAAAAGPLGFDVTLEVFDGEKTVPCTFHVTVSEGSPYGVEIMKIPNQYQNQFTEVGVVLHGVLPDAGIGGFDFLVAYDASALAFQQAIVDFETMPYCPFDGLEYTGEIGSLYDLCGWEYFTYRFGPYGNCGNGCPSGLLRVIGMAETNNGPNHPLEACMNGDYGYWPDADMPVAMFKMKFLVSNDRNLNCQFVPIRFFWIECGDNAISSYEGDRLFVENKVFDFMNSPETQYCDKFAGAGIQGDADFPTYIGWQPAECPCIPPTCKVEPEEMIDFQNGGVDIVCSDSIDAPGDINMNAIPYEIADAVMFTNYFIVGLTAFGPTPENHQEGSIAASDCNKDGIPLTVADLVYLIRVVVGDALPYAKTSPIAATFHHENGVMNINSEMGAAYIVFEGSVTPELLVDNMTMQYSVRGNQTHVLVFSTEANQTFEGNFLRADGQLASVEFATYEGQPVAAKNVPTSFSVEQNYPNPFNPTTTFAWNMPQAGDWTVSIYNITGQLVETSNGHSEAGQVSYEFNASGIASGIYFYKVVAGDNTETKKMVFLK